MKLREKLLSPLESAIGKRESGDLKVSRRLLSQLLRKAGPLKASDDLEDNRAFVRISHEWIIQIRHEGKAVFRQALVEANILYEWARSKRLRDFYAIHNVSTVWMDLRDYESPQRYFKEMLDVLPPRGTPLRGYTLSHYAECLLRAGKMKEAAETATEALRNFNNVNSLEIASWKVHALLTKAIICQLHRNKVDAIKYAKEALNLAQKFHLLLYREKAHELLKYLGQ